jgi:hypothetical protein
MKNIFLYLPILILCTSCPGGILSNDNYEFEYETIVTEEAVNLEGLNSPFDDYNSALPYVGFASDIYFSCNRHSKGEHFDITYKRIEISYHDRDDVLNVGYGNSEESKFTQKLLPTINSDFNELGPLYYFGPGQNSYFLYSNNENGNYDIKSVYWNKSNFGSYKANEEISEPYFLNKINSDSDDLYPTFSDNENELYFCSNRDGENFNIYKLNINENLIQPDSSDQIEQIQADLVSVLSSNGNDKCPSIHGNIMLFTSDRPGGFGGYDLYFSIFENGAWSDPINFGEKVNSKHDEYRPILVRSYEFDGRMIIFSSNRTGGRGGYDLYAVRNYDLPPEPLP